MALVLDGRPVATAIHASLQDMLSERQALGKPKPRLAIVMVGQNADSAGYAGSKARLAQKLGIECTLVDLPASTSEDDLNREMARLGADASVSGVLVELPLPKGLSVMEVFRRIPLCKDIEGMSLESAGRLMQGTPLFVPATPAACIRIMDHYGLELQGQDVVIVGRSRVVGRPLASLLLTRNATVTVCHSFTRDLRDHTRRADVLIVAAGEPSLITADHVKPGAVVIDVGTTYGDNGRPVGDVDYAAVMQVASAVTPVPGGVGPVTTAIIMANVLRALELQERDHPSKMLLREAP